MKTNVYLSSSATKGINIFSIVSFGFCCTAFLWTN